MWHRRGRLRQLFAISNYVIYDIPASLLELSIRYHYRCAILLREGEQGYSPDFSVHGHLVKTASFVQGF